MTVDTSLDPPWPRWSGAGRSRYSGLYDEGTGVMRERARNIRALLYPPGDSGRIESLAIPGPAGPIPAQVVRPRGDAVPTATLVYFHGGGVIVGDLDSHEAHCIRIANLTGAAVVNVDYRLAPEDPFPAGVEDALAAMRWVHAQRARFAGTGRPLAVGGDSAGGNLAAVSAVACRDEGIALAAQFLLYPATNLVKEIPGHGPVTAMYLGTRPDAAKGRLALRRAWPYARGVAPAIIGVGTHDFLYQDNIACRRAARFRRPRRCVNSRRWATASSATAIVREPRCGEALCDDCAALCAP